MRPLAYRAAGLLALVALLLSGCAAPARHADAQAGKVWSGRLAVQVQDQPGQSFAAGFELRGGPQAGQLALFSPLGSTLALLRWAPGLATLDSQGQTRRFDSLDDLALQAAGTAFPVAALFDWLTGADTPVPGWRADLSQLSQGRLLARRSEPPPAAELRVALDP